MIAREEFPVAVMRVSLSDQMLNNLLLVTDALLSDRSSRFDYSIALAGRINRGKQRRIPGRGVPWLFQEERRLIFAETEALAQSYPNLCAKNASVAHSWASRSLELDDMWCVSQLANDYNPRHAHNGTLSGVFYLQVPSAIEFDDNEEGCLAFVQSNPFLEKRRDAPASHIYDFILREAQQNTLEPLLKRHIVRPRVGEGWIFPSWLLHEVPAFHSAGERRSVAFNLNVKYHCGETSTRENASCYYERVELFT